MVTVNAILPQAHEVISIALRLSSELGAGTVDRTPDLIVTNDVLYRLSYSSLKID